MFTDSFSQVLLDCCKEHTGSMRFPALLYTCILSLLSLIHCIPIHQDDLKNVKLQAETIIIRIGNHIDWVMS